VTDNTFPGHPQQQLPVEQQPLYSVSVCIGSNIHEMPPPESPSEAQQWHESVTPNLRSHFIGKLVKVSDSEMQNVMHNCNFDYFFSRLVVVTYSQIQSLLLMIGWKN
jgi:hypothetical protein